MLTEYFNNTQDAVSISAERGTILEKKLAKHHGGYIERAKNMRSKILEANDVLAKTKSQIEVGRQLQVIEEVAIQERLQNGRDEVELVSRREREDQATYRQRQIEIEGF